MITAVTEWLQNTLGLSSYMQRKIFVSIITIIFLWIIRILISKFFLHKIEDNRSRYRWQKTTNYFVIVLGIVLIGRTWIEGLQSVVTYLGLLSAGLAIALKDPITNLAGWLFIIWRKPFELGDRIQIGNHAGDVIDIRIFQFTLFEIGNWVDADQNTGRVIHIPNGKVFTEVQANYSKGFQYIWNEIPVLITFESNWEKAKDILHGIVKRQAEYLSESAERKVREAARRFLIIGTKLHPQVYTSVEDSGVLLTIRYICEPRERRDTTEAIWEEILQEFAKNPDIDFAYPTRRIYSKFFEDEIRNEAKSASIERQPENENPLT